ncbi:MAG: ROK family protein [Clostridia bacterium]|nr:ROK family protein [Clostridia bacterium]
MMKYCIGFDIGGTKCAVSLGKIEQGNIRVLRREEVATTLSPTETLDKLLPFARAWKTEYGVQRAGISCGGPLDSVKGVIVSPPNLPGWHGFSIVDYVKTNCGLSAKLQNDANACAVAEWRFGAGRGTKNMVFLTFGTGLGAGLILDGRLYAGTNDNAGEAGHIRLAKIGPVGYGKEGSFEGFCSGGGITRLAKMMAARLKKIPESIEKMGGMDEITTKKLAQAAFEGDKFAKRVFQKSGEMLGKGLSVLIDILNPERIVIGGVYMRSSALLIPSMEKVLQKEALAESRSVCEIVGAKLSENIGDIAALAVADMD